MIIAGTNIAHAQSSPKTVKKYGDWALSCRQLKADGPERCVLFQDILWQTGGKRILNVSITRTAKDKPFVAAVATPLGILLPAGLTLNIDEKELVRFPLRLCNINGCRGQFPLSEAMEKCSPATKRAASCSVNPTAVPCGWNSPRRGSRPV